MTPSPPRPLDQQGLTALALRYVARYATTEARLAHYLQRKLAAQPWAGDTPPDIPAITARMVSLGYVDDAAWAAARTRTLAARGLGPARIAQDLQAAGAPPAPAPDPLGAALRFAERKRLGPFARTPATDAQRDRARALAAFARAGHSPDVARQILSCPSPEAARALAGA